MMTVPKSFGVASINLLSVLTCVKPSVLFNLWLCLLLVCDFTFSIVYGQTALYNANLSSYSHSSITNICNLSDLPPIPYTLEMSSVELPGILSVKYSCKDSYMLVGDSVNVCLKGKWVLPPSYHPKCIKCCSSSHLPFSDITINGKCELNGETFSCHELIKPKTIAHTSCAFGYRKPDVGFIDALRCNEKGEWDTPVPRCEQICGLKAYDSIGPTSNATVPWHVGIFGRVEGSFTPWTFHPRFHRKCGGTIVSAKIVISAANCFVESITNKTKRYDKSDFRVIAGNYSRNGDWDREISSLSTLTTQILNVAQIIHNDYMGRLEYFPANFALLVLVESIIFTPTIQPVCLELDYDLTSITIKTGLIGNMAAWDTNNDLKLIDMFTSGQDDCLLIYNSSRKSKEDKFCATNGYANDNVCEFDQGTGLVVSTKVGEKRLYFLRGIAGNNAECGVDTLFTNIQFYTDIISENLNKTRYEIDEIMNNLNDNFQMDPTIENSSVMDGSCWIPAELSDTIQIYDAAQPDREIPKGSYVNPHADVIYRCKAKHAIIGRKTDNYCWNGKWEYPNHPECIKLCPPLNLSGATTSATCEIDGETISCHQELRPNTIARLTCAIGYRKSRDIFYDVLQCGGDGEWDYDPYRCEPICGVEAPEATTYIIGGDIANITKVPWHVGIFSDIYNEGRFSQICGGTILNAKVVISAAHCFWDSRENRFHHESNFKVAAGKYYRDFYASEPIGSQILNITNIYYKPEYSDYAGLYAFDIVLLIVEDYIFFKSYIKPICVETLLYNEKNVSPGLLGRVAGWGRESRGGKSSAVLKVIDLPAIEYHKCKDQFSDDFQPFITPDKFCAGFTDGQSVCEGDSGGGLVFPKMIGGNLVYYLRGIVSAGDNKAGSCDNDKYTVFTNIQYHIEMITFIESTNRPK